MRTIVAAALVGAVLTGGQEAPEPFTPFEARAFRFVNGLAFEPGDRVMYFSLLYREVLALRGRPDSTVPEVALFRSERDAAGRWSEPELVPFSGRHHDYEPALARDGSVLLFNSKRAYPDGRVPTRNDLWMARRDGAGWGAPIPLAGINSFALEESYPSLDDRGRLVFVRGPVVEGGDDFDLYESRLGPDGTAAPATRLPFSGPEFGEGDPQLAPDGSYLIFTRWDHRVGWSQTCDLYLAFRTERGWSAPRALAELNSPRPDYSASISADGRWLYYRSAGRFLRRPLGPVIERARAAAGS